METYVPTVPGSVASLEELLSFVVSEQAKIAIALLDALPRTSTELHAEPSKPRGGLVVFADGTDWNPGSGQGFYAYYASAWHFLG